MTAIAKHSIFMIVFFLFLSGSRCAFAWQLRIEERAKPQRQAREIPILGASKVTEVVGRKRRDLVLADASSLQRLARSEDRGVALHAVWEIHQRRNLGNGNLLLRKIRNAIDVSLPARFRSSLIVNNTGEPFIAQGLDLDVVTLTDEGIYFNPPICVKSEIGLFVEGGPVIDVRRGKRCLIRMKHRNVLIDTSVIESTMSSYPGLNRCAIAISGDICCLALYSRRCERFPIHAFHTESGKPLWTSIAWGMGTENVLDVGQHYGRNIELTIEKGQLFVFGSSHHFSIESFDLTTGEDQWHFATTFWYAKE